MQRARDLVEHFRRQVGSCAADGTTLEAPASVGVSLLQSMLWTRHLDVAAHELRHAGHGHYTICNAGHESNAVLGHLTGTSDPALVHYRSTAFQLQRAREAKRPNPVLDIALSLVASSDDPTSGGRHKVLGMNELGIVPSTSTIASHLPRAVGLAFAIERRGRLGLPQAFEPDAIAIASFGDASANHSTALGAFNAASWVTHQRLKLPLLLVCEDNGLGISTRTPTGWIETSLSRLPHLEYFSACGWEIDEFYSAACEAVTHCRSTRRPAVLHVRCERLLGHAGSDVDTVYRTRDELELALDRDPVTNLAQRLIRSAVMASEDVLAMDRESQQTVASAAATATERPKLQTRAQVAEALTRDVGAEVIDAARALTSAGAAEPATLAQGINGALAEALERYPEALIFGQDVAKKGGVYGLTKGLLSQAGPARVFNTLLDEQTILGLALGTATLGLLPVPEIQYLAYVHNALDQLRGEAATMSYFSNAAYDNPMLIRIAGFAYQKGFGGHFHNDNSVSALRDIPGISIFVPARADDAAQLYRLAFSLARVGRRVVVSIEPIALYHTRDLHDAGDEAWLSVADATVAEFGRARVYFPTAPDLTIATYGNGVRMSLRAARHLRDAGIRARVVDLRWLKPLPFDDILSNAQDTGRLLFVDECRRTGSVSEEVLARVAERVDSVRLARVTADDCFVPLGDAAQLVLVSETEIVDAATKLARG